MAIGNLGSRGHIESTGSSTGKEAPPDIRDPGCGEAIKEPVG